MEADECIRDQRRRNTSRAAAFCTVDKIGREADQCDITIVELAQNQGSDGRLEDGRRDEMADAAKLTQCCKAA